MCTIFFKNTGNKKSFLGATFNGSAFRNESIKNLKFDYYQLQIDNCTDEMMKEEIQQSEECDFLSIFYLFKKSF